MGDYRQIDEFASRQYGCFNIPQLRAAGIDRAAVARKVSQGAWLVLAPGVYATASAPPIWERQLSAAVLSRPRAVVGGSAAARLYEISGFINSRPVIVVPRTGNARSPIARVIRSAFYRTLELQRIRGFLATSPADTLLTLAADLSERRLEGAVEECLLSGKASTVEFQRIFDRIGGGRVAGSARLRRILQERYRDPHGTDSTYLERLLEVVLSDRRIPRSIREFSLGINGAASRVDALISDWNLVVEADGRQWHARVDDFETDRARDNELAALGLQVVRFTYDKLKRDRAGCVATLLAVGAHRGGSGSAGVDVTDLATRQNVAR